MSAHHLRTLIVGRDRSAEMRPVLARLAERTPRAGWRRAETAAEAAAALREPDGHADLGVILQEHPAAYAPDDAAALLAAGPLVRWICACGAWCESEGRTGSVWPDALRIPARQFASRLDRELAVLAGHRDPLAWTASRDETFLFDAAEPAPPARRSAGQSPRVAVIGPDRAVRRWLADLLITAGFEALPDADEAAAVVYDADPLDADGTRFTQTLASLAGRVPIVALTSEPADDAAARLRQWGAAAVIPKLAAHTLPGELRRLLP
jgi:hypothetical protein